MSNILTQVRKALLARLETISTANGYQTNVGNSVKSGWFNEIVKDGSVPGFGLLVVQKAKAMPPESGPGALKMRPGFHVIGAVNAGLNDYEEAIEALEFDLLQCLCPTTGVMPEWLPKGAPNLLVGAPEPFPPGDGLKAATVLIPVHIIAVVDQLDY
jgi:hypothetical protein